MKRQFCNWPQVLIQFFKPRYQRGPSRSTRLVLEDLQDRIVPSVFNPNTLTDGGANSLRADILIANADKTANATEVFNLQSSSIYELTTPNPASGYDSSGTTGDLNIHSSAKGVKTYVFNGLGAGATIKQTEIDRVMSIVGSNVIVEFKNVTITGGHAVDDGVANAKPGTTDALGGGILNEGAEVEFFDAAVVGNSAIGAAGVAGSAGRSASHLGIAAGSGNAGGNGGNAYGGGLYSTSGTISVLASSFKSNQARAGEGGQGGNGGAVSGSATGDAGFGGNGGAGGNAAAGAIYLASGTLTVEAGSNVTTNGAIAGNGAVGGKGGEDGQTSARAGRGGEGGAGGNALAGAIYSGNGNVTISSVSQVNDNMAEAGGGGRGGIGGKDTQAEGHRGVAGNGGLGGSASGGGLYLTDGTLTIFGDSTANDNKVTGGRGGEGETGGAGGSASGGGAYLNAGHAIVEQGSSAKLNIVEAGDGGQGETGSTGYSLGGNGGDGGQGGNAVGGGVYNTTGSILISLDSQVSMNSAQAGLGGNGGAGGDAGSFASGVAGNGGAGGDSGNASGGGLYLGLGLITVDLATMNGNRVSIQPGAAAEGGVGGNASGKFGQAGAGGNGGSGGNAIGGAIASIEGTVDIGDRAIIEKNQAVGHSAGVGGAAGKGFIGAMKGLNGVAGAAYGGGASVKSGSAGISSALIASNQAISGYGNTAQGGGLYFGAGTLNITQANFENNTVTGCVVGASPGSSAAGSTRQSVGGGGLYVSRGGVSLTLQDSSITNNDAYSATATAGINPESVPGASDFGGGIYLAGSNDLIANSTIANNLVTGDGVSHGGGIFLDSNANTTLDNDTIVGNESFNEGGGIENAAPLSLNSTIVAENYSYASNAADFNDLGSTQATDSIVQDGTGNSVSGGKFGNQVGISNSALNLIGNLTMASNGTEYVGLASPSVAIGAGSNLDSDATDQLGYARTVNGRTDVGAFESGSSPASISLVAVSTKNGYVELLNSSTGQIYQDFQPFAGYGGVVSVTLGDVSDDGVPDLIVAPQGAFNGQVLVYDGRAAVESGVDLGNAFTWSNGTANILPGGESTPLLDSETPFAAFNYKGGLNIATGDVNQDGHADIIVATVAGSTTRVAVLSGANPSVMLGGSLTPFGPQFTGGATVAAGDLTGTGAVDMIVGSASKMAQVVVYGYSNNAFNQIERTITPFGNVRVGVQVTTIDETGTGVDEIAVGILNNGAAQVAILDGLGDLEAKDTLGKHLTAFAIGTVDVGENGQESLLFEGISVSHTPIQIVNPNTDASTFLLADIPTLVGGVALAGC